uniref:EARP and GARP complex-interacting protein 1 n=1 Tax=Macaca mulatta TaxID=9544 RepID=A0A5F7ZT80_MACMU
MTGRQKLPGSRTRAGKKADPSSQNQGQPLCPRRPPCPGLRTHSHCQLGTCREACLILWDIANPHVASGAVFFCFYFRVLESLSEILSDQPSPPAVFSQHLVFPVCLLGLERNLQQTHPQRKTAFCQALGLGPVAWQCLTVWNVRYNHSHDQLVLTGSSDSRVILSNMVSISSEPFGHLVDDDDISDQEDHRSEEKSKEPLQDNVIATYEEHEDSVYAVDWSSADPWLFASLSYDGRLVINRVPRALKYHILL